MNTLLHLFISAERGGCGTTALALIRGLPEWKHFILVLSPPGPMSCVFQESGAEVHHLNLVKPSFRRVISDVKNYLSETEPAGLVLWHGMVLLPEILSAAKDYSGNVYAYGGNPAVGIKTSVDAYFILRELFYGRRADVTFVCCSNYVADSFSKSHYLKRFPRAVIPNGIRDSTVGPHSPRSIGSMDEFTIGMVARLDPIKDYESLLRSFAIVKKDRPFARLQIAGDGDLRSALEILADNLRISASVEFLGMVTDVYPPMSTWDLFVYSTTEREGLGSALAEAMIIGMPCVVSDVGPMREVTGDPPTARMVAPGDPGSLADAILDLISDCEERKRLGAIARARALNEFDARVFARRYRKLLDLRSNAS